MNTFFSTNLSRHPNNGSGVDRICQNPIGRKDNRGGFALIIALSLMAFVMLLLLSITSLIRVESSTSASARGSFEAQMNAQLGAMVALGNLQKFAGLDQRVTARADVVLAEDPEAGLPKGTSFWTGVWSTKTDSEGNPLNDTLDLELALNDRQPRWLVSGQSTDYFKSLLDPDTDQVIFPDIPSEEFTVPIVRKGTAVTTEEQEVLVVKEPIEGMPDSKRGGFAYWVSDEGVKARVNLENPLDDIDPDADYYKFASAQQADPTVARDFEGNQPFLYELSAWKDENVDISKISSPGMLPLLGALGDPSEVKRGFFHDFSTTSRSVFANVKEGGLKQDLSVALLDPEQSGLIDSDDKFGDLIFPPANLSNNGIGDPGGPKWVQLSDHYKYALNADDSSDTVLFKPGTNNEIGIAPVISRFHLIVQVVAARKGYHVNPPVDSPLYGTMPSPAWPDAAENYGYRTGLWPMITLWNPYDKDMTFDADLGMETDFSGISLVLNEQNRGKPRTKMPDGNGYAFGPWRINGMIVDFRELTDNSDPNPQSWMKGRHKVGFTLNTEGLRIPAGRAVNFSPPINSTISLDDATLNVLKPGGCEFFINGFFTEEKHLVNPAPSSGLTSPTRVAYESPSWHEFARHDNNPNSANYGKRSNYNRGASKLSFVAMRNIVAQEVSLYKSSFSGVPDPEDRFLNITFNRGTFNRHFAQPDNATPRVVRTWEITSGGRNTRQAGFRWIGPMGITKRFPFSDTRSPVDIRSLHDETHPNGSLNGIARYMAMPEMNQKYGNGEPVHITSQFNPRAPFIREPIHVKAQNKRNVSGSTIYPFMYDFYQPTVYSYWTNPSLRDYPLHEYYTTGIDFEDNKYSPIGMTLNDLDGTNKRMSLFEAPTRVPLGIGQFMHANLMNVGYLGWGTPDSGWGGNFQQPVTSPSYAIGNSMASAHMALDMTREEIKKNSKMFGERLPDRWGVYQLLTFPNGHSGAHYDYSYELNDALWDQFYMSTLIPGDEGTIEYSAEDPLPNARIRPWNDDLSDFDPLESKQSAAHLVLDGGFNINSTSVAAWEAVLGALRDVETLGEQPQLDALKHHFSRFADPQLGPSTDIPSYSNKDEFLSSYKSLTDDQISRLAEALVDEIKVRSQTYGHPFLSLSEFINRSIRSEDVEAEELSRKRFTFTGPLQFAIDQSGVNGDPALDESWEHIDEGTGIWDSKYIGYVPQDIGPYNKDSLQAIKSRGLYEFAPGSLMQADILSKIGSSLVARSDTFTIRSYGESSMAISGDADSKAYLELTVQRIPNYIAHDDGIEDAGDKPYESPTVAINERFGRSFRIVSSRWINEDEI
ncbi:MAG: hypothetical protein ACON39_06715 [Coraliomargaritaceae bacterium]